MSQEKTPWKQHLFQGVLSFQGLMSPLLYHLSYTANLEEKSGKSMVVGVFYTTGRGVATLSLGYPTKGQHV